MERVPKIDGYTMPPPRMGGAGAVADMELNAMFKSVLHRPTTVVHTTDSLTQAPFGALQGLSLATFEGRPLSSLVPD